MDKKNLSYILKYEDEVKELCEEHGIEFEDSLEMIDYFFKTFKGFITEEKMPKIQVTNLGTFKPTLGKLDYQIRMTLFYYRRGSISREKAVSKISKLWTIKQRLIKEANGEATWDCWRKNNTLEEIKENCRCQKEKKNQE